MIKQTDVVIKVSYIIEFNHMCGVVCVVYFYCTIPLNGMGGHI